MHIRPATIEDAEGMARVGMDTWRTAYRGIVPDVYLDSLTNYQAAAERWRQRILDAEQFAFVAVSDDGSVAGYANGGPERDGYPGYEGELYGMYVLQEYQGSGIGKALLNSVAHRLADLGYPNMILWVFTANTPSRGFYEHLGGRQLGTKMIDVKGTEIEATAYGWEL